MCLPLVSRCTVRRSTRSFRLSNPYRQCSVLYLCRRSPKSILDYRKWPPLRAKVIVSVVMSLMPRLSAPLFQRICRHAVDPAVCADIVGRPVRFSPLPPLRARQLPHDQLH